ncbi:hypothetical protein, partial [Zhongshania sp.]|uniref:hypothetical protein n=1 Tax=Zhongshania sp. TaxID=1971902 RepID=UPI0035686194
TLAVRLIVPLAGPIVDSHHQVIQSPPRGLEQRPSRRYAPCLAHAQKKEPKLLFKAIVASFTYRESSLPATGRSAT